MYSFQLGFRNNYNPNTGIIFERIKFITKYNIITKYVNTMCNVKYCTIIEFEYCCLQKISVSQY